MIYLALIAGAVALAAFLVMVVSIRRSERRKSLFDSARGGCADAFTRKVLALHVHQVSSGASHQSTSATRSLAGR